MDTKSLYNLIKQFLSAPEFSSKISLNKEFIITLLEEIYLYPDSSRMTRLTVLLEGLFKAFKKTALKSRLIKVREERWKNNHGVPTILFLLTHATFIDDIKNELLNLIQAKTLLHFPFKAEYTLDVVNNVLVNEDIISTIPFPELKTNNYFIKTFNPEGGYAMPPNDQVSKQFLSDLDQDIDEKTVLEIGTGFGAASLAALNKGARVFCNDSEPKNLSVVQYYANQINADKNNLILLPGYFPNELNALNANTFNSILISRVLHFLSGPQIEIALSKLFNFLKKRGKLYIICETPYLKNWTKFIPEYEKRKSLGMKWPGEIEQPALYENSGRAASLPPFVHWITKEILERSLINAGFKISFLEYLDRKDSFPKDLLLDGRESIGAIAIK